MGKNYSGNKKKEIIEKKINNQNKKFKLVITDWVENVLTKFEEFFDDFDLAKRKGEQKYGSIKIYDNDEHVIHSQKNERHYNGKKPHQNNDDELYA